MKFSENMSCRESDVFVPRPHKISQAKSRVAQLIATAAFGMMVLSVGTLLTIPTILVGALHKPCSSDPTAEETLDFTPSDSPSSDPLLGSTTYDLFILDNATDWFSTSTSRTFVNGTPDWLEEFYVTDPAEGGWTNETISEEIQLTEEEASWLGSVMFVVQPVGSIASGFIQGHIGRRNGMMATSVVQLIGWISLYFCNNVASLFSAAVLMGLSIGFMEAPGLSFLGEVIEPRYRGSFANIAMNMWLFGVLLVYLLGAVLSWRYVCLASTAVPAINFIILCLIPESPVFLLLQGKERQAEASLRWLRGWTDHEAVRDEYEALVGSLDLPRKHSGAYLTPTAQHGQKVPRTAGKSKLRMLCEKRVSFPLLLLAVLFFAQHSVALAGLKPFLVNIFKSFDMQLSAHWILVFSGLLQLLGIVICAVAIRFVGKRVMVMLSGACSTLICLLLAVYTYVRPGYPAIPMVLFAVNFLANGLGIMSIPWILISEVFPTECRGSAAGIAAASSYILGFIITKTFKPLESAISLGGCLLVYAVVGFFGTLFAFYKLPETEGKSLADIQQLFKGKTERGEAKAPKGHYY